MYYYNKHDVAYKIDYALDVKRVKHNYWCYNTCNMNYIMMYGYACNNNSLQSYIIVL